MKQTLEFVHALAILSGRTYRAKADGKFTKVEKLAYLADLDELIEGLNGITEIPAEFAKMDESSLAELRAEVGRGLIGVGISHRDTDAVDAFMTWAYTTVRTILFLKNRPVSAEAV